MDKDSGTNLTTTCKDPICTTQANSSLPIQMSSGSVPIPPSPPVPPPYSLPTRNQTMAPGMAQSPMQNLYNTQSLPYCNPYMIPNYGYNNMYYPGQYNSMLTNRDSRFVRLAEESSRSTFQSMESVVQAVRSFSFLTESVFGSVNTLFRAALTVVESASGLKHIIKSLIASLLALRIFRKFLWVILTLLRNLGLISADLSGFKELLDTNDVYNRRTSSRLGDPNVQSQASSWPFMGFMAFIIAAPYLISKVLPNPDDSVNQSKQLQQHQQNKQQLQRQQQQKTSTLARAVYNFTARNQNELTVTSGEVLEILNEFGEWLFAKNSKNERGLIPKNHMHRLN